MSSSLVVLRRKQFGTTSTKEVLAVMRWFQKFRRGELDLEDKACHGRRTGIDDNQFGTLVEANTLVTVRELAKEHCVGKSSVWEHLRKIRKTKLKGHQKNLRFEVSSALLLRNKSDPVLDRIVICGEKWILYDNWRRSAQWLERDEAPQYFPEPKLH